MDIGMNQYNDDPRGDQGMNSQRDRERFRDRDRRRDRRRRDRRDRGGRGRNRDRSRERYRSNNSDMQRDYYEYDNGAHGSGYNGQQNLGGEEEGYDNYMGDEYYGSGEEDISEQSNKTRREPRDSRDYGMDNRDYNQDYNRDSRSRPREGRERRDRDRDRDREREHSRDRDHDDHRREDRGGMKWITETPTNTILLRGLPSNVDEKDIRAELMIFGAPIKEVRLMKHKDTGVSRGFAFVEFQNVPDAQRWMEQNQGQLLVLNQYKIDMNYSTPKTGPQDNRSQDWLRSDWICSKCGAHNFKRRDYCFKCSISKDESERTKKGDGSEQVGNNPCNTLILRGLDALTTEENILAALGRISSQAVKNVKVMRDDMTGTSQGYAFLELHSIQDSTQLLKLLTSLGQPFEVDGKAILVAFAKNTFTTVMATMTTQQQWQQQGQQYSASDYSSYYQQTQDQTGAYYDATTGQYYDPQTGQYYDYATYYAQAYGEAGQQQATDSSKPTQSDTANAAAAVAQAAIQQAQAAKNFHKQHEEMQKHIVAQIQQQQKLADMSTEERLAHQAQEWSQHSSTEDGKQTTEYAKYPVPDVSTYQYDETSGYYYDPTTGLYYDANSQYYYNAQTGQFLYWDGEKQTYLLAPSAETSAEGQQGTGKDEEGKTKKDKEKKEKVKIAKKIAKDMEKWAKTLNAQKEAMKEGFKKSSQLTYGKAEEKESAAADAGFAILEKRSVTDRIPVELAFKKEDKKLMPPPPPMMGKTEETPGALVASYGGDSDDDEEDLSGDGSVDEAKLVDLSKMACLLCKRQFPSREALQRHQQLSDLHKKNLEDLRRTKAAKTTQQMTYRDRAKERREKYGQPEPPLPKRGRGQPAAGPVPYEEPTKAGLGNDNIGNKLLQKMGWSAGQGLGRANQGITDPIQAMKRQGGAGLGSRGSNYNVQAGDTYKDTVKKVMYARYQELE